MASEWMNTEALRNVSTGFCNIATPDTGNPNAKNPKFRKKPPQWKMEVVLDRVRDAEFLNNVREFVSSHDEDYAEGEEPWVLTKDEKTITKDDGEEVTYPAYEYIRVQTKKDPHEQGIVVGDNNRPFTDEIYSNSDVSVAINTMYNSVSNHIVTFYLGGVKVHRNGSGGGGGGKNQAMQLLGVPEFGSSDAGGSEDAPFDPSQL